MALLCESKLSECLKIIRNLVKKKKKIVVQVQTNGQKGAGQECMSAIWAY